MGLGSANVAELLAHAGFETKHNALGSAETQQKPMAMNDSETIQIVRLPSDDPIEIQRALDFGAMGVFISMIRNSEQVRSVVRATRYLAQGVRRFGPLRASTYKD